MNGGLDGRFWPGVGEAKVSRALELPVRQLGFVRALGSTLVLALCFAGGVACSSSKSGAKANDRNSAASESAPSKLRDKGESGSGSESGSESGAEMGTGADSRTESEPDSQAGSDTGTAASDREPDSDSDSGPEAADSAGSDSAALAQAKAAELREFPCAPEVCALRKKGEELLAAGDWREAIPFLEEAAEAHSEDPVLHFLLARAGAQALAQERCAYDRSSVSGIRQSLQRALALGVPRALIVSEPDFEVMKRSLWFQFQVLERDPMQPKQLRQALEESAFLVALGTASGAFGAKAGVDFQAQGEARLWQLDINADPPRVYAAAIWKALPKGELEIELKEDLPSVESGKELNGQVVESEFLEIPGFGRVGDDDFECSA